MSGDSKEAIFEAARRGNAVFLDHFMETFYSTEVASVLAVGDYIDYTSRGRGEPDKLNTTPLTL